MSLILTLIFLSGFILSPLGYLWTTEEGYSMPNLNLKAGKISPNQFEGFGVSLVTNKSTYSVSEPIIIKVKVF